MSNCSHPQASPELGCRFPFDAEVWVIPFWTTVVGMFVAGVGPVLCWISSRNDSMHRQVRDGDLERGRERAVLYPGYGTLSVPLPGHLLTETVEYVHTNTDENRIIREDNARNEGKADHKQRDLLPEDVVTERWRATTTIAYLPEHNLLQEWLTDALRERTNMFPPLVILIQVYAWEPRPQTDPVRFLEDQALRTVGHTTSAEHPYPNEPRKVFLLEQYSAPDRRELLLWRQFRIRYLYWRSTVSVLAFVVYFIAFLWYVRPSFLAVLTALTNSSTWLSLLVEHYGDIINEWGLYRAWARLQNRMVNTISPADDEITEPRCYFWWRTPHQSKYERRARASNGPVENVVVVLALAVGVVAALVWFLPAYIIYIFFAVVHGTAVAFAGLLLLIPLVIVLSSLRTMATYRMMDETYLTICQSVLDTPILLRFIISLLATVILRAMLIVYQVGGIPSGRIWVANYTYSVARTLELPGVPTHWYEVLLLVDSLF